MSTVSTRSRTCNSMMFLQSSNPPMGCSKSNKTFCPKRLRKQLNNEEFKQFYFELVPNNDQSTKVKMESDINSRHYSDPNKYSVMSFQHEASEQEKMRKAIHQCSSHFHVSSYMHHSRRKKLKSASHSSTCDSTTSHSPYNSCSSTSSSHSIVTSPNSQQQTVIQNNAGFSSSPNLCHSLTSPQEQPTFSNQLVSTNSLTSPSSTGSEFMLSLDHDGIIELLLNENSPFCHLLKTPIYARHN